MKYAAVPLLAMLAACSAEGESSEAESVNTVETLTVNTLIVAQDDAATAVDNKVQTQEEAPAVAAPVARTAPAEPRAETRRTPTTEASSEPATKRETAPAAEPKPEASAPESSCSPEHREMGHC